MEPSFDDIVADEPLALSLPMLRLTATQRSSLEPPLHLYPT